MIVQDVIDHLETLAPLAYAEDFDNVGLLIGKKNMPVTGVLVTLDTLETVVDEAVQKKCNMIVSFHPIIFDGLKQINNKNYVQRCVAKAIQNNIAVYAIHTALDNSLYGVNATICDQLNIQNRAILIPKEKTLKRLVTYVPKLATETVLQKLFEAGAGALGNYSNCSFMSEGIGTFEGNKNSKPKIGKPGKTEHVGETRIGITFPMHLEKKVLDTLFKYHPYEEVAYEICSIDNINQHIGMGMIGTLEKPKTKADFFSFVKKKMGIHTIKFSEGGSQKINKIAVLGGSGSFAIEAAKAKGADVFITADLKYHDFFRAEGKIILMDIGHYESEQFTKNLIVSYLTKKIHNFAIVLSQTNTNPVKYF